MMEEEEQDSFSDEFSPSSESKYSFSPPRQ